jgi:hypothetical protein
MPCPVRSDHGAGIPPQEAGSSQPQSGIEGTIGVVEENHRNLFVPEAKSAANLLAEGDQEKNRDFLKKIGSSLTVAEKRLSVELKNPWKIVAEFNCAPMFDTSNSSQN